MMKKDIIENIQGKKIEIVKLIITCVNSQLEILMEIRSDNKILKQNIKTEY